MLNAIIIDDEVAAAGALSKLLAKYCPDVKILDIAPSADEGEKKINTFHLDLVFLRCGNATRRRVSIAKAVYRYKLTLYLPLPTANMP